MPWKVLNFAFRSFGGDLAKSLAEKLCRNTANLNDIE
jgi:hypothetical protein